MVTRLTKSQLLALDPCDKEQRKLLFTSRSSLSAVEALTEARVSIPDILWVAAKLGRKDLCVRFAAKCAQRVAHLNTDPRVQAAIDAANRFASNPTMAAARAADWAAAGAARAAAGAARAAARAAAEAAGDAARAAARAARAARAAEAARAAAWEAAGDAAWATQDAARTAEDAEQRRIFIEIFKDA